MLDFYQMDCWIRLKLEFSGKFCRISMASSYDKHFIFCFTFFVSLQHYITESDPHLDSPEYHKLVSRNLAKFLIMKEHCQTSPCYNIQHWAAEIRICFFEYTLTLIVYKFLCCCFSLARLAWLFHAGNFQFIITKWDVSELPYFHMSLCCCMFALHHVRSLLLLIALNYNLESEKEMFA